MRLTNARVVLLKSVILQIFQLLILSFCQGTIVVAREILAHKHLRRCFMADSLPIRNRKIRLLTLRDVYRETRLTKKDIEGLEKRKLIKSLVPGPNPLYSFEQLEEVIAVLTDQAIAMTDLDSLRRRMRDLRATLSMSDDELKLFYGIDLTRLVDDEDEKEAA
jgi:hypothetical protein